MKPYKFAGLFLIGAFWLAITLSLTACNTLSGRIQPLVPSDIKAKQRFNEATAFPYTPSSEVRHAILSKSDDVTLGMTGDEVFKILGTPDEIETLAFPFESARGWAWSYSLYKEYRDAPAENDSYVLVIFDKEGKVSRIHKENVHP